MTRPTLRAQLDAQTRRGRLLRELLASVTAATDARDVLDAAAASAASTIGDAAAILLLSPDGSAFELAAARARDRDVEELLRTVSSGARLRASEGIAGRVLASGEAYLGRMDAAADASKPEYAAFLAVRSIHGLVAVPLRLAGTTIGVFEIARYRSTDAYTADDAEFAGELATLTALAFERVAAQQAERRSAERARVLAEFVEQAAGARDEREALDELARRTATALDCTCSIYLANPDRTQLDVIALAGARHEEEEALRTMFAGRGWRTSEGTMGRAFESGQTVVGAFVSSEERAAYLATLPEDRRADMARLDMRAVIAVPMKSDDTQTGVLAIARWGDGARPFTDEEHRFAEELARRANLALARIALGGAREADTRRARVIAEFVESAGEASDEEDLLRRLSQAASDAAEGSVAIYRLTPDGRELDVVAITSHEGEIAEAFRSMYERQRWRADEGFMGQALTSRSTVFRPYLGPDERVAYLGSLPEDRRAEMAARDLRAIVAIPLGDRTPVGILTLARYGRDATPLAEADRAFAAELAGRTNVALARLALHEERARESERKRLLAEFLAAAIQLPDERDVIELLATRAVEAVEATCNILRVAPDGESLESVGAAGHGDVTADDLRAASGRRPWRVNEGLSGRVFATGEPVSIPYLDDATRGAYVASLRPEHRERVAALDLRGSMHVPLRAESGVIGVLVLSRWGREARPFHEDDLRFAIELADRASLALTRLALAEQRERTDRILRTVFEASPLPISITGPDRRVRLWNPAAERLFGFSAEEAIGGRTPILPDGEIADALELGDRVVGGETIRGLPVRRKRKDGTLVDVELYSAPIPHDQGGIGLLGIYADVTERNRLQSEMQRTSETLRAILDASPLPIITVDAELRVTFWNRAAETVYGWTAGEVMGRTPPYAPPDDADALRAAFDRVGTGETVEMEATRRTKDGRTISVRFVSAPLFDEAGRIRGSLGISQDVTEQKHLEAELLQAQKMETVGRLAGGVAHDFNNILTAIIGYTELAQQMPAEAELLGLLGTVKTAAERAAGLTQQLLAFSRRQMLQPRVVDANEVILRMEPILRRLIGEDVELLAAIAPDVGSVLVDPTQLEQVILNLAINARDAMPEGGRLVLRTDVAHVNGDQSHVDLKPGDYVAISVSDTGVGMDDETRARIFEPFFTTKELGKGTGLGLSTTYGIVRQSGGHIWVSSEPGRGSTFKLYFPRVDAVSGPIAPAAHVGREPRRGNILLVEDEPALRDLGRLVLTRAGYEVTVAGDPTVALAAADNASFDLLATDVVMPAMTGIELARRLRERDPDLRVLFMSGYAEDITDAAGSMTRRFLAKSFTADSLLAAVDDAIRAEADLAADRRDAVQPRPARSAADT